MVLGARKSSAATARLSVRATEGGPLVTPNAQFFRVSQKGYPAKAPTSIGHVRQRGGNWGVAEVVMDHSAAVAICAGTASSIGGMSSAIGSVCM